MIYDISLPLSDRTPVWPGDPPFERRLGSSFAAGDEMDSSSIRASAHLGTHVDAPGHFTPGAGGIDEVPLEVYLGPCRVLHRAKRAGELVSAEDMPDELGADRLLVATGSYDMRRGPNAGFAALAPDLIPDLARRGLRLVGLDTPSVDPVDSTSWPSHKACGTHGIAILEGAVLADVPDGVYELIALPLRLVGLDGSPVRAALRPLEAR